jgi:hypothetical protein
MRTVIPGIRVLRWLAAASLRTPSCIQTTSAPIAIASARSSPIHP